ncbi:MAG: response regulator transcription factor [Clostridium sp.]|nr:response regulator transcription factor [Clostridium sp.]
MKDLIKVMVAEDLDILREHYCEIIQNEASLKLIASAANGKDIVNLVKQSEPDVILMDIEMETKNDGIVAAKQIIENYPNVHIVFLTVHEDDETIFSAFESGAIDYILKNSSDIDIVKSIKNSHDGISSTTPEIAYKIMHEFSNIRKKQNKIFEIISIISHLTPSENEVLSLLISGKKATEIAKIRHVELTTTKSQINAILKKFNKKRSKEVVNLINDLDITNIIYEISNTK